MEIKEVAHTHTADKLTLCFGTDKAGRRVAEGAQDGSDGQAQILITRIKCHWGEAQVRQLRGFLRTDLHVRDLEDEKEEVLVKRTKGKQKKDVGSSRFTSDQWDPSENLTEEKVKRGKEKES